VGPITALPYVLTLENPERFAKSRDVGPYLGLVSKQEDSRDSQPQLRMTKMGDVMVRQLLVGSAHYILGPFGPDTDLRCYGLRLSERGREEREEARRGGGSAQAGGTAAPTVGERRGRASSI
jgi:transposase